MIAFFLILLGVPTVLAVGSFVFLNRDGFTEYTVTSLNKATMYHVE